MNTNFKNNVLKPTKENLKLAAKCIEDGGVIVAPSDTNLALTLNPWNTKAIERAFSIKNRPANSPLTLFFTNPNDWEKYASSENEKLVQLLVDKF